MDTACYPYESSSLALALNSAIAQVTARHGAAALTPELITKLRRALAAAMEEQLGCLKPHQTCDITCPLDPDGVFPVYRVINGGMTLILKDVEIVCARENGVGVDSFRADYLRIETREGSVPSTTTAAQQNAKKRGR